MKLNLRLVLVMACVTAAGSARAGPAEQLIEQWVKSCTDERPLWSILPSDEAEHVSSNITWRRLKVLRMSGSDTDGEFAVSLRFSATLKEVEMAVQEAGSGSADMKHPDCKVPIQRDVTGDRESTLINCYCERRE